MGFLITLPSNSSEGMYPDNTISRFQTYLPQEISLESDHEVALTEIQYTNSFYNLPEDCDIQVRYRDVNPEDLTTRNIVRNVTIKKGYYKDIETLIGVCHNWVRRHTPNEIKSDFQIDYLEISRKAKIRIPDNTRNYRVSFPKLLQAILGFGDRSYYRTEAAERSADINACVHSMFIYSNIVEPRIVGDAMVPLIRVLAVHGTHNEYVVDNFYHLQYIPLRLRNFRTIEIDLRNNMGTPMPFHSGEAILTLHFRKITR